ncbi:MAG: RsmD family RNA methyltransferase [Pirellulales bacterium]
MARHRKNPVEKHDRHAPPERQTAALRIIGGELGGRKLLYIGHLRTRPMKDRVREAVFNLLGSDVTGKHAVDLFAGTGALGLEAISRGAVRATFVEQHFPTARILRQNAALLSVADRCKVDSANVFSWVEHEPIDGAEPWLVFCSPPYAYFVERQADVLALLGKLVERAPAQSVFVVESDARFDTGLLPALPHWDVRQYLPAVVAIGRK